MKKAMLFLFALVVAMGTNVQAQSLKKLYPADAEVVITPLPFAWEKCTPYLDPVVDFTWEKGKGLPLFSYRDLNGLLKNESEEDLYIREGLSCYSALFQRDSGCGTQIFTQPH